MTASDAQEGPEFGEQSLISLVDQEIASGAHRLRFAAPIEHSYLQDGHGERSRLFLVSSGVAVVLYDIFLINDWLMLRDMFPMMLLARLAVFTPVMLLCMLLVSRTVSPVLRESLGVFSDNLAVFLPMTALVFSASPHRLSYQFGTLLVMVFCTMIQRLPFRYAAVSILGMLTIQCTATYLSGALDWEAWVSNTIFFCTGAALLLLSAYFLERADRLSYLFSVKARLLHAELAKIARTDPLTQLYNRYHLGDVMNDVWKEADASATTVSAILIDIDHFKAFNDTYGHMQGDACLRVVSGCIADVARAEAGLAFRFGGEEMLVLMPGRSPAEARAAAERIRTDILAAVLPHPALGEGAVVTASFGVAAVLVREMTMDALIAAADTALYAAKRAGRNCVWPSVAEEAPAPQARCVAA